MKTANIISLLVISCLVCCGCKKDHEPSGELKNVINLWRTNVIQYEATNPPKHQSKYRTKYNIDHVTVRWNELGKVFYQLSDSNRDIVVSDALKYLDTKPKHADYADTDYDREALAIYGESVGFYIYKAERRGLVDLLSKRCDEWPTPFAMIEVDVCAPVVGRPTLTNAFGVFFEAYAQSQSPSAKASICQAVRRALKGYSIDASQNDDKFMAAAKIWEEARWQNLKANTVDYPEELLFGPESEIKLNPN